MIKIVNEIIEKLEGFRRKFEDKKLKKAEVFSVYMELIIYLTDGIVLKAFDKDLKNVFYRSIEGVMFVDCKKSPDKLKKTSLVTGSLNGIDKAIEFLDNKLSGEEEYQKSKEEVDMKPAKDQLSFNMNPTQEECSMTSFTDMKIDLNDIQGELSETLRMFNDPDFTGEESEEVVTTSLPVEEVKIVPAEKFEETLKEKNEARSKELRGLIFDKKYNLKTMDDVSQYIAWKRELLSLSPMKDNEKKKIELTRLHTRLLQDVMVKKVLGEEKEEEKSELKITFKGEYNVMSELLFVDLLVDGKEISNMLHPTSIEDLEKTLKTMYEKKSEVVVLGTRKIGEPRIQEVNEVEQSTEEIMKDIHELADMGDYDKAMKLIEEYEFDFTTDKELRDYVAKAETEAKDMAGEDLEETLKRLKGENKNAPTYGPACDLRGKLRDLQEVHFEDNKEIVEALNGFPQTTPGVKQKNDLAIHLMIEAMKPVVEEKLLTLDEAKAPLKGLFKGCETVEDVDKRVEKGNDIVKGLNISDNVRSRCLGTINRLAHANKERITFKEKKAEAEKKYKIEVTQHTRLMNIDSVNGRAHFTAEPSKSSFGGYEEVKGARVFKGEDGHYKIIFEEENNITELRMAKDVAWDNYYKVKREDDLENMEAEKELRIAQINLYEATRSLKDLEDAKRDLKNVNKKIAEETKWREEFPNIQKLTKKDLCDYLEDNYMSEKKERIITIAKYRWLRTGESKGLEKAMPEKKKKPSFKKALIEVIDNNPNEADTYARENGIVVEDINIVKARVLAREKKKETKKTKIVKFVAPEEVKGMDFSEDLSNIANLFNAM